MIQIPRHPPKISLFRRVLRKHIRPLLHFILSFTFMDEKRIQASVKNDATSELSARVEDRPREPRKRFVGRRTAAERVSTKSDSNSTIEETGVMKGEISG